MFLMMMFANAFHFTLDDCKCILLMLSILPKKSRIGEQVQVMRMLSIAGKLCRRVQFR